MTNRRAPNMTTRVMRFAGAVQHEPAIERWFAEQPYALRAIAREWFTVMRACGPDVRELIHDDQPTACIGDAAFAYVDAFTAHVNVGFFLGAQLRDPCAILEGTGRFMRHVKVAPGRSVDKSALTALIQSAYADIKHRVTAAETSRGLP